MKYLQDLLSWTFTLQLFQIKQDILPTGRDLAAWNKPGLYNNKDLKGPDLMSD